MSLEKLLEYQETDLIFYKKQIDFKKSEIAQHYQKCLKSIKNKKAQLEELKNEVLKNNDVLLSLDKKISEYNEDCVDFEEDFDEYTDLKDFERYEKDFSKFEESVNNIGKEIVKNTKKMSEINSLRKNLIEIITKLTDEAIKTSNLLEEKKKELAKECVPYVEKLKKMQPEIDEELFAKYREVREKKLMPAIVRYDNGNCLGCGIEIKLEVDNLLQNKYDYTECPHCGRIVYKMK